MLIAITGSSGFIGTPTVKALEARGHQVVRMVRPGSRHKGIYWDPSTGQIDRDGLTGVDAVIHLAGEPIASIWTPAHKRRIYESRVNGTQLLATTLAQLPRPPRVLVSASAIGFYGNRPDGQPIDESAPRGSGFLADVVVAWEAAAEPARAAGIRVVHPRFGLILAKHGGALKPMLPVFKLGLGGRIGSGRQYWSWVTLDDVVRSILHVLDRSLDGPVNVVAPSAVTNAEFTKALADTLNRPAFMNVPEFLLKLMGGPAEELVLFGVHVVPRKLLESGFEFRHTDLRAALAGVLTT